MAICFRFLCIIVTVSIDGLKHWEAVRACPSLPNNPIWRPFIMYISCVHSLQRWYLLSVGLSTAYILLRLLTCLVQGPEKKTKTMQCDAVVFLNELIGI